MEVNATCGHDDIRGDSEETYCKLVGYDTKSYDSFSVSMGMNTVDGQVRKITTVWAKIRKKCNLGKDKLKIFFKQKFQQSALHDHSGPKN